VPEPLEYLLLGEPHRWAPKSSFLKKRLGLELKFSSPGAVNATFATMDLSSQSSKPSDPMKQNSSVRQSTNFKIMKLSNFLLTEGCGCTPDQTEESSPLTKPQKM
jgi:hypothetical protein